MTEFTTRWCEATMGRIPCARPEVALYRCSPTGCSSMAVSGTRYRADAGLGG